MQQSANYALKLPEGTDNVKRQDFVDNFTNIDTQLKAINDNSYPDITATGTNAYVGTSDRIKALAKGTKLTLFVGADATGNCTLNLNSYGAKNIKDSFGNIVNNLKANIPYNLCYNGTDFILQGKGGGGNALPSEIIKNKTATTDTGPVVGTLDLSNLVSGNIKSGVTINGVSGSQTIVDTADAVLDPNYLVSGYSGYDDGVKKNGQLPNLGASQTATDTWTDGGGTLVFRVPSTGAFTSVVNGYKPEVNKWDGNFVSANIPAGKTIFGLAGSYDPLTLVAGDSLILFKSTVNLGDGNAAYHVVDTRTLYGHGGTVRIKFSMTSTGQSSGIVGYARIYINGSPRGIERSAAGFTPITFTEDFSVNAGDVIQLYTRAGSGGYSMSVTNYTISCGNNYAYLS